MIIILIIIIIIVSCCCSCISLSGGYYYYTQSEPASEPASKPASPKQVSRITPVIIKNPAGSATPAISTTPIIVEKVSIEQDKYKITDADGIKTGVYKNIPNATFLLINNLNRWKITIILKSDNYKQSYQGIIGNMYNNEVTNGWGLWINPNGKLHFRIEEKSWDLNILGILVNNHEYQIIITYSHRSGYSIKLTNLKYFNKEGILLEKFVKKIYTPSVNEVSVDVPNNDPDINFRDGVLAIREVVGPGATTDNTISTVDFNSNVDNKTEFIPNFDKKLITNKGFITIGGWWEIKQEEKFKGDINYLEFYKM